MSVGIGHRSGLDLALLWLWGRPAATAPIQPLAWEPPFAIGVAPKKAKKKKKSSWINYGAFIQCLMSLQVNENRD